jgi:pimeloyl-ACP methyl ester carboxylesterase
MDIQHVTSKDGTSIAYTREGNGPALILVGGGAVDRSENVPLAAELAAHFTTYNYDRRGRGDSGEVLPYAVEREIEDLGALIDVAGEPAHLYGASSGGALAMEAAAAGLPVRSVAVYEVPYSIGEEASQRWRSYGQRLRALLAENRRGDAFELFMRVAGTPEEMIAGAKASPVWAGCEAIAPTLAYDALCLGDDGRPPVGRLATITQPIWVGTGGASPDSFVSGGGDFFDRAADAIVAAVPRSERAVVAGQTHAVEAKTIAPLLERFFRSWDRSVESGRTPDRGGLST